MISQKFDKRALIASLKEKKGKAQSAFASAEKRYAVEVTAWQSTVTKQFDRMLAKEPSSFKTYGFSSPPSKPQNETDKFAKAIKQLEMMAGDEVNLKPDDRLLGLAL